MLGIIIILCACASSSVCAMNNGNRGNHSTDAGEITEHLSSAARVLRFALCACSGVRN